MLGNALFKDCLCLVASFSSCLLVIFCKNLTYRVVVLVLALLFLSTVRLKREVCTGLRTWDGPGKAHTSLDRECVRCRLRVWVRRSFQLWVRRWILAGIGIYALRFHANLVPAIEPGGRNSFVLHGAVTVGVVIDRIYVGTSVPALSRPAPSGAWLQRRTPRGSERCLTGPFSCFLYVSCSARTDRGVGPRDLAISEV